MKPEDVLAIAQQGNPKVIAALMNRTTEPHGVFVRVARRRKCLYILVEGNVADQRDVWVRFIQASLQKLQVRPIDSAIVYGRLKDHVSMAWSKTIKIPPVAPLSPPHSDAIPVFTPRPDRSPTLGSKLFSLSKGDPTASHFSLTP